MSATVSARRPVSRSSGCWSYLQRTAPRSTRTSARSTSWARIRTMRPGRTSASTIVALSNARSTVHRSAEALKHGQLGVVEQGDRAPHHAVDEFARQPAVVEVLGAEAVSQIGQRDLGGSACDEFDPQRVTPDCAADRDDRRSGGWSSGNVAPAADVYVTKNAIPAPSGSRFVGRTTVSMSKPRATRLVTKMATVGQRRLSQVMTSAVSSATWSTPSNTTRAGPRPANSRITFSKASVSVAVPSAVVSPVTI